MSTPLRLLGIEEEFESDSPDQVTEALVETGPRPPRRPHALVPRRVTFEPGEGEPDSLQQEEVSTENQQQVETKLAL